MKISARHLIKSKRQTWIFKLHLSSKEEQRRRESLRQAQFGSVLNWAFVAQRGRKAPRIKARNILIQNHRGISIMAELSKVILSSSHVIPQRLMYQLALRVCLLQFNHSKAYRVNGFSRHAYVAPNQSRPHSCNLHASISEKAPCTAFCARRFKLICSFYSDSAISSIKEKTSTGNCSEKSESQSSCAIAETKS